MITITNKFTKIPIWLPPWPPSETQFSDLVPPYFSFGTICCNHICIGHNKSCAFYNAPCCVLFFRISHSKQPVLCCLFPLVYEHHHLHQRHNDHHHRHQQVHCHHHNHHYHHIHHQHHPDTTTINPMVNFKCQLSTNWSHLRRHPKLGNCLD